MPSLGKGWKRGRRPPTFCDARVSQLLYHHKPCVMVPPMELFHALPHPDQILHALEALLAQRHKQKTSKHHFHEGLAKRLVWVSWRPKY